MYEKFWSGPTPMYAPPLTPIVRICPSTCRYDVSFEMRLSLSKKPPGSDRRLTSVAKEAVSARDTAALAPASPREGSRSNTTIASATTNSAARIRPEIELREGMVRIWRGGCREWEWGVDCVGRTSPRYTELPCVPVCCSPPPSS